MSAGQKSVITEVSVTLAPPVPRRPIKVHKVSRASMDMHEAFGLPLLAYCGASVTLTPPAGAGQDGSGSAAEDLADG